MTQFRPQCEHDVERALNNATAVRKGDFTLQSGLRSRVHINVRRLLLQPDSAGLVYAYWAHSWFNRDKRPDAAIVTRLLGYGEEGERLGWGLQSYLKGDHSLTVVTDSREDAHTKLGDMFQRLNGQPTLILAGVIDTPRIVSWLARSAEDVNANLLGVACIASFDPTITAETLRVPRLTVGLQLDCLIPEDESGV